MTSAKGRVLLTTSNYPRWEGDSTTPFVLNLAKDLQQLGWEVDVLAPHTPGAKKKEIIEGVNVERFQYLWPEKAQTVCYQGGALINLRKNKSNFLKLPALVFFELLHIVLKLRTGHYDVLHSHWILPQGFTGVLAAKLFSIPHVITVHGGDVFVLKGKILNKFKQFSLKYCNAITVNSLATKAAVEAIITNPKQLNLIPMGVAIKETGDIAKLKEKHTKNQSHLLIFVGRLVEEKGVEDFIRSIDIVTCKRPDVHALIIGEGQDKEKFESLCRELVLDKNITFTGWVPPEQIHDYLSIADVFIGPTRISEAQGLTFLEAMAAKTPVIATKIGGITDYIKHGETGFLVNERAPEEIAESIEYIFNEPQAFAKIKDNAYKMVLTKYSREVSANSFSELYTNLIKLQYIK